MYLNTNKNLITEFIYSENGKEVDLMFSSYNINHINLTINLIFLITLEYGNHYVLTLTDAISLIQGSITYFLLLSSNICI